ncbi:esterase [Rosenbergiella australiborealis]|uniref:Esterase n=1 Tax=Rosenbergiella australiborealis TaxID=1544696 RepID=A0ABS5T5N8_9GAMM|nr:esterase [Rosenbergiella australiborealis]MBT0727659.1 esterase [Rosenbergiella australiborealis]
MAHIDYVMVQQGSGPQPQLFILFHRNGDDPRSMAEIGQWFGKAFPTAFVISVGAPIPLVQGGSAWFIEEDAPASTTVMQQKIDQIMPLFMQTVRECQKQCGVSAEATALIGFSEGSTMILEALKNSELLAGRAIIFSGRYNSAPNAASMHTTIHLIHGDDDEHIPLIHAVNAEQWLKEAGGDVTLDIIDELPHAIDDQGIEIALKHLRETIPQRYFDQISQGEAPDDDDVIPMV